MSMATAVSTPTPAITHTTTRGSKTNSLDRFAWKLASVLGAVALVLLLALAYVAERRGYMPVTVRENLFKNIHNARMPNYDSSILASRAEKRAPSHTWSGADDSNQLSSMQRFAKSSTRDFVESQHEEL